MRMSLVARPRTPLTKGQINELRRNGSTPISVSGIGENTNQFVVSTKEMHEIFRFHGTSALIDLDAGDVSGLIIARDIQRHPVSGKILHVGFQHISGKMAIIAPVTLRLIGEPEGVRNGGVLEHETPVIQVRAMPDRLPEHLDIDVSGMVLGDIMHVSDLPEFADIEIISSPETVVAVVHIPRAMVEAETTTEIVEVEEAPAAE